MARLLMVVNHVHYQWPLRVGGLWWLVRPSTCDLLLGHVTPDLILT
jgi:hypothetical protein